MRSIPLSSLLVLIFASAAVFGFVVMVGHADLHSLGQCVASTLQGMTCPQSANTLERAGFQLNVLRSLFTAFTNPLVIVAVIAALFLAWSTKGVWEMMVLRGALAAPMRAIVAQAVASLQKNEQLSGWLVRRGERIPFSLA